MKQDCTTPQSTADETKGTPNPNSQHSPKGTHVTDSSKQHEPAVDSYPEKPTPWCYLFVHHKKVAAFEQRLIADGITHFVHTSVKYVHKRGSDNDYRKVVCQTVSGLIFLKGQPACLQQYLDQHFPNHHLCRNCSTGKVAEIPNRQMEPFMRVAKADPDRIRFLLRPFEYYSQNRTLLRITTGDYAGLEGYVIRIARDRKLVMDVGGISVAIGGVHAEHFEEVDKNQGTKKERQIFYKRNLQERHAFIDRYFHQVNTPGEAAAQADTIDTLRLQALADLQRGELDAKDVYATLCFAIEEIGYYYAPFFDSRATMLRPVFDAGSRVMDDIQHLIANRQFGDDTRQRLEAEYQTLLTTYGYLF